MAASAPDSPAMRTRARARLALNPAAPAEPEEIPPSRQTSPSPSAADEPAEIEPVGSFDFEWLPDPARERVYSIIESWSSSPGRVSPVLQQLATMSVTLRADLKPRTWAVVEYYAPPAHDSTASSRTGDLRKLDQLNKGSPLPIQHFQVHGLGTTSTQQHAKGNAGS